VSEPRTPTVFQDTSVFPLLRQRWPLLVIGLAIAVLLGGWFYFSFYDRGYAPIQPIAYSHKLHAGDLGIDCRYCHFNAERGKHAGIPPTSVCLGCHATDKGGVNGDKPEIKKLLAMAASDDGSWTDPDTKIVHEGGAIHWNRVHKLPDFVYFSHEWHVKAGVACQTCHGPVEKMEVVRQHADLSMGWCLSCHRKTNYVGGPVYDGANPENFNVGTGNYDVLRARIKPDAVVEFIERETKQMDSPADEAIADHGHGHDEHAGHAPNAATAGKAGWYRPFGDSGAPTPQQLADIRKIVERFPQLKDAPSWRLADLPETHRAIYAEMIEELARKEGHSLDKVTAEDQRRWLMQLSFQNSPTQCSTCHQ